MNFQIDKTVEILKRSPLVIRELLDGLSEEWIVTGDGDDGWSAYDIVGHLVHGEKTDWIPRIRIILNYGESRPFDPFDRFAQFEDSNNRPLSELLDVFSRLRVENLKTLNSLNLTSERLGLKGTHPQFGLVTLKELLATWVVHDLNHIAQIASAIAKKYARSVGPWAAYLPILGR